MNKRMKKSYGNLYQIKILQEILDTIGRIINKKKIKKVFLKTYFKKIKIMNNQLNRKNKINL